MGFNLSSKLAVAAAMSLCAAPVGASAATLPAPAVHSSFSPMMTLSVLGSGVSAAALCGAAATAGAQARAGGCVLPAVDAPPPVPTPSPLPLPAPGYQTVPVSGGSSFLLPLIGGLAALIGVLALIGLGKDKKDGGILIPPSPVTPQ